MTNVLIKKEREEREKRERRRKGGREREHVRAPHKREIKRGRETHTHLNRAWKRVALRTANILIKGPQLQPRGAEFLWQKFSKLSCMVLL